MISGTLEAVSGAFSRETCEANRGENDTGQAGRARKPVILGGVGLCALEALDGRCVVEAGCDVWRRVEVGFVPNSH